MDASQYKDYVLTFLFLKYVSDKYLNDPKAMIVVPDGCSFPDIAIPALGAGLGGLDWDEVRQNIETALSVLETVDIYVYSPGGH